MKCLPVFVGLLLCGSATLTVAKEPKGPVAAASPRSSVADAAALQACLMQPGATCVVSAKMTVTSLKIAAENVTLNGAGLLTVNAQLEGVEISAPGARVTGVAFSGPGPQGTTTPAAHPKANCTMPSAPPQLSGCAVPLYIRTGGDGARIDHDTFTDCGDKCIVAADASAAAPAPDNLKVEYNTFSKSFFGVLLLNRQPGVVRRATFDHNTWNGVFRRQPRASGDWSVTLTGETWLGSCRFGAGGFGPSAVGGAVMTVTGSSAQPGTCASRVNITNGGDMDTGSRDEPIGPGRVALDDSDTGLAKPQ